MAHVVEHLHNKHKEALNSNSTTSEIKENKREEGRKE
jgi:hypothetical protein